MYYVNLIPDGQGNVIVGSHGRDIAPREGFRESFATVDDLRVKYPAIADFYDTETSRFAKAAIDQDAEASGVSIERSHGYKYAEAILFKTGMSLTTPLKYLEAEAARCGSTIDECADMIISKAHELEPLETDRVTKKAAV